MTMNRLPLHSNTPLLYSQKLYNQYGKNVWFKMDALQPSGSFKLRGIGKLCQTYFNQGHKKFVASSGGNAGIAVAYSAKKLGVLCTVFIPSTSHQLYIDELKSYGASVIVAGNVWDEAHAAAVSFAEEQQAPYIPPFDHPIIWSGNSTLVDELVLEHLSPDVVITAVGGGGLACGLLEGMHRHDWDKIPLLGVETIGADSFAQSVRANQLVTLKAVTSKATSLGAKQITPRLLEWTKTHNVQSVVVSDEAAEEGARAFARDKRVLVELAAGAPLSLVYSNHPSIQAYNNVVVIVCGGINISFFRI
jgi:L-serine/L-threonine ammonia-lyase